MQGTSYCVLQEVYVSQQWRSLLLPLCKKREWNRQNSRKAEADMRTDRFFISARPSNESFLSQPGGVTLTPPTPLFLPHRWDFPRAVAADTHREHEE